jgi:MFS superfamily sulfate permease-like transporter
VCVPQPHESPARACARPGDGPAGVPRHRAGADSRTAINEALGGKTQVAGLVAAITLAFPLLFLTRLLAYLPLAALGAVLASAAIDLFDYVALQQIRRVNRIEFIFALIAILGVVAFGVLQGVIVAIFATLIWMVSAAARPRDALLGRIAGHDGFYKLHRHAEAEPIPGVVIYLFQGPIVFFNCDYLRSRIGWIVNRVPPGTRHFILEASASNLVDGTGAAALSEIATDLSHRGITFRSLVCIFVLGCSWSGRDSSTRLAAIMCSINSSMLCVL